VEPGLDPERDSAAPAVMLLCVWWCPGTAWRARVVLQDATAHEFHSPFDLAQFLGHAPVGSSPPLPRRGLR
jgi:hypothetical protein